MPRVVHRYDPPERFVAGTVGEPGARTFFLQARDGRRVTSVSLEKEQVAVLAGRVEEILDQASDRPGNDPEPDSAEDLRDADPLEAPITEDFRVGTLVLAWQPSTVPGGDRLVIQAYAVTPPGAAAPEVATAPPELDVDPELTRLAAEIGDQLPPDLAGQLAQALRESGMDPDPDDLDDPDDPDREDDELADDEEDGADGAGETDVMSDPLAATEEDTDALVVRLDPGAARAFARRCAAVVAAGRPPCPFCGRPLDPAGHLCPRANGYRPARG